MKISLLIFIPYGEIYTVSNKKGSVILPWRATSPPYITNISEQ